MNFFSKKFMPQIDTSGALALSASDLYVSKSAIRYAAIYSYLFLAWNRTNYLHTSSIDEDRSRET